MRFRKDSGWTVRIGLLGRTRMRDVTGIVDVERDRRWRHDADVDMSLLNCG
jgi:hypothetical protein